MRRGGLVIFLTIILSLVMTIAPMPISIDPFRPDWVLIVIVYWTLALPHRVSIGVAFLSGLVLDILLGSAIGVHSLALTLSTYMAAANYQKIRNFSVWQQALIVGLFDALFHLILFWTQRFLIGSDFILTMLWPVLTTVLMWPWAFLVMRKIRRFYRVN